MLRIMISFLHYFSTESRYVQFVCVCEARCVTNYDIIPTLFSVPNPDMCSFCLWRPCLYVIESYLF